MPLHAMGLRCSFICSLPVLLYAMREEIQIELGTQNTASSVAASDMKVNGPKPAFGVEQQDLVKQTVGLLTARGAPDLATCGSVLFRNVKQGMLGVSSAQDLPTHFGFIDEFPHRRMNRFEAPRKLLAAKGFDIADQLGRIPDGSVLIQVGNAPGPFMSFQQLEDVWFHPDNNAETLLVFEAGFDFRHCWGSLEDFGKPGQRVCSDANLEKLRHEVDENDFLSKLKVDTSGQGGSKILFAADFAIKSASSTEYNLMSMHFPVWGKEFADRERETGGCVSTAMAPVCAAFIDPRNGNGETVYWLLMRAIKLNGRTPQLVRSSSEAWDSTVDEEGQTQGGPTNWFDVKGPIWQREFDTGTDVIRNLAAVPGLLLKSNRLVGGDGKTMMSKNLHEGGFAGSVYSKFSGVDRYLWRNKDIGFASVFPEGVSLKECGGPEAIRAFVFDARMLAHYRMTDYSAFLQLYKHEASDGTCWCSPTSKPTFPIVLHIKRGEHGKQPESAVTMAIGVLDYIEQMTNQAHLSTMKEPFFYSFLWTKMFDQRSYFQYDAPATDSTFRVGDRVMAITALACTHANLMPFKKTGLQFLTLCTSANEAEFNDVRIVDGRPCNAQPFIGCGVYQGDFGTVAAVVPNTQLVLFDGYSGIHHRVDPYKVVRVNKQQ